VSEHRYREAGAEVIRVLVNGQVGCVERASIDEAYVDLTDEVQRRLNVHGFSVLAQQLPNTVVAGFETAKEGEAEGKIINNVLIKNGNIKPDGAIFNQESEFSE
jgi:nucleotidyltransferase/DNA polymerase involved in DNA repair